MKMVRPSKDEYFMGIVEAVSKRSTCLRHQIGAVLVNTNNYIIATGYNGAPKGLPHCLDIGCLRNEQNIPSGEQQQICRACHAEQNAILQAVSYGGILTGATLYTLFYPCIICSKMIINVGISRVVYRKEYPNELGKQMFRCAEIEIFQYKYKGD